jgi:hypothetical protein
MQELFTFDPTTNTFTVNEKDITTGTPKQIGQDGSGHNESISEF